MSSENCSRKSGCSLNTSVRPGIWSTFKHFKLVESTRCQGESGYLQVAVGESPDVGAWLDHRALSIAGETTDVAAHKIPLAWGVVQAVEKEAFYICMLGLFGKHRAILQKTEQLSWWTKFKLHFRIRKEFDNNQNPPFPDGLLSPRPTRLHQLTTRFHNRWECAAFFLIAPFDSPANATHGGGVCKWDLI